jgi:hypothetical protein
VSSIVNTKRFCKEEKKRREEEKIKRKQKSEYKYIENAKRQDTKEGLSND